MPEADKPAKQQPLRDAGRWSFVVEADGASDTLLRVLNPFVLAGAEIAALNLERRAGGAAIRIDAENLDERRGETLRRRLEALAGVKAVGVVWRCAPAEPPMIRAVA